MLFLVGTPDLLRQLNRMRASFWERTKIIPLGLLTPEAAADAIRIPMEAERRSISAEALTQVVAESHGCPFFVQLWGQALRKELSDAGCPASQEDVDRARPVLEAARDSSYRNSFGKLKRAKLALVAARQSAAFANAERLTDLEIDEAVREALESEQRA